MKYLGSEKVVQKICWSVGDAQTNIHGFLSPEFT